MEEKTCGTCACWRRVNELLGSCSGNILKTGRLCDRRDDASSCLGYRKVETEVREKMIRIVATYYGNDRSNPFDVRIYCANGRVYQAVKDRVMQARCAGWANSWREYVEDGETYTECTWTGSELNVVLDERQRIR